MFHVEQFINMGKRVIKTTISIMERATLNPVCEICLGVFDRPSQSEKIRASLVESNPKLLFLAKHEELVPNLFLDESNSATMD